MGLFSSKISLIIFVGYYNSEDRGSLNNLNDPEFIKAALRLSKRYKNVPAKNVQVVLPQDWYPGVFDEWSLSEDSEKALSDYISTHYDMDRYMKAVQKKAAQSSDGKSIEILKLSEKDSFVFFFVPYG